MYKFQKNISKISLACRSYVLTFIVLSFFLISDLPAVEKGFPEAKIKTAYLYNFLRFVEWPTDITNRAHLCVVGHKEEYHDSLQSLTSLTINNEYVTVKEFNEGNGLQDLTNCRIIFVTTEASHRQKIVVNTVRGKNTLTVGESAGFASHGGMINFIERDDRINFEVNLNAVSETDIKITSRILRIADRIIPLEKNQ